jgi:hypothetical protein
MHAMDKVVDAHILSAKHPNTQTPPNCSSFSPTPRTPRTPSSLPLSFLHLSCSPFHTPLLLPTPPAQLHPYPGHPHSTPATATPCSPSSSSLNGTVPSLTPSLHSHTDLLCYCSRGAIQKVMMTWAHETSLLPPPPCSVSSHSPMVCCLLLLPPPPAGFDMYQPSRRFNT